MYLKHKMKTEISISMKKVKSISRGIVIRTRIHVVLCSELSFWLSSIHCAGLVWGFNFSRNETMSEHKRDKQQWHLVTVGPTCFLCAWCFFLIWLYKQCNKGWLMKCVGLWKMYILNFFFFMPNHFCLHSVLFDEKHLMFVSLSSEWGCVSGFSRCCST